MPQGETYCYNDILRGQLKFPPRARGQGPGARRHDDPVKPARPTTVPVRRTRLVHPSDPPEQASDLYIADGTIDDWLWADQGIFTYTFEMYPTGASRGGFYPPGSVIARETSRNREAVLRLMEYADCPYRAIGRQAQYCGTGGGTTGS